MADDVGFKIYNKFYPLVLLQDWNWGDFTLSHRLTDVPTDELFSSKADSMLLQQVLIGVAIGHTRPEMNHDQLVEMVYKLKPSEVEEIGFEVTIEDDDDASPPDEGEEEQNPSLSSESSEPSGGENQDEEKPEASGTPGLDTGSQE